MKSLHNPFRVGDRAIYKPSQRGRGYLVMTGLDSLVPEKSYFVVEIEENDFLVLRGYENCMPRSIHWTEFKKASDK